MRYFLEFVGFLIFNILASYIAYIIYSSVLSFKFTVAYWGGAIAGTICIVGGILIERVFIKK